MTDSTTPDRGSSVNQRIADALEASEERYRFLAESIPVQIWTALPDGNLDYVTEQTARALGLTAEKLLSDGWQNVLHPDDLPLAIERWTHALTTGEPYEVEFRLKLADGAYASHLARALPQRNAAGKIVRWFGTNTNIEDQRAQQRHTQALHDEVLVQAHRLREQNHLLALEADIGVTITRSGSLRDALTSCMESVVRHLDAAFARVWALDETGTVLVLQASAGLYTHIDGPHGHVPVGKFKIGKIAAERKAHLSNDVATDPQVGDHEWAAREKMVAFAGYPLTLGDKLIGVIAAFARHPFSEASLSALGSISNGIALSIERHRAEEKLRVSERWLSTTLTSIGDGVIATDAKGNVTFLNPVASSLTGFAQVEAAGKPLDSVFPIVNEDSRIAVENPVAKVLREGVTIELANHTVLMRRDGSEIPIDDSAAPIRNEHGEVTGVVLVFRDAGGKRRVEEERIRLLEQEKRARLEAEAARAQLHALFMQTPALIAVTRGPTHVYELVNPTYNALLGDRLIVGKPVREALPELEGQGIYELLDEVYTTGKEVVGNEVPLRLDRTNNRENAAETRYFNFVYRPLLEAKHITEGILVFAVDVTAQVLARLQIEHVALERHELLEARVRAERDLNRIFGLSLDLIYWGKDGRFVKVNPAFEKTLGWSESEMTATPIIGFLHPEDVAETLEELTLITASSSARRFECRLRCTDGSYRWISWSAASEGGIIYSVGRDVTHEKADAVARAKLLEDARIAQRAAEKANRAMDEFLATISHELRTPLNAMLGWTRLLRGNHVPESARPKALETIERNASMQAQLIEDLLDVSRIISGKMRLDVVPVELVSVIEAALDVVRPAALAKGVRLHQMLDPGASHVTGDAGRLQQVIWNLVANAVKFTPKDGRVEVRLSRVQSLVEIAVSDTGQGIDLEFLDHVFERFRQADGAMTRSHGGLGLGLSIVKNLVELHGGSVRAESAGIGKGSTFSVRLPLSLVRPESIDGLVAGHPYIERSLNFECPAEIHGLRVLVVDDEKDARELLVTILEECGALVTSVASGHDAMMAIENEVPQVIVSDVGMPDEDGYSLIRKIRSLPPAKGGRVPVVALTAYARAEDRTRALRSGFNMHVPKPIEPSELLAVIASLSVRNSTV